MHFLVSPLSAYLPADVDFLSMVRFIGLVAFAALFVGLLARVVIGKGSSLNHAVSASMGILCVYAASVVIYTFNPYGLDKYLADLPFVTFRAETLRLFSFEGAQFSDICREVLSMIILAFLVNLLDTVIPKGKKPFNWLCWRLIAVGASMAAHYLVTWAFHAYLPGTLAAYAPTILLLILVGMFALGILNVILSVILTVVNPIFGILYTFFFSNIIGKQISKSVVTTGILCGVVYLLEYLGYSLIAISAAALPAYLPLIVILVLLWYVIGHLL